MDDSEDSSVIAAAVNVICELSWRRPHDFLPLAPRLFDLLVDGGNNWMAIKIIKLVSLQTPLELPCLQEAVRLVDTFRAATGQKAFTAASNHHSNYSCYVTSL